MTEYFSQQRLYWPQSPASVQYVSDPRWKKARITTTLYCSRDLSDSEISKSTTWLLLPQQKGGKIDRNMDPGLVSPPKLYFLHILGTFYIEK